MGQIAQNQASLLNPDGPPAAQLSLLDVDESYVEDLTKGANGQFTGELLHDREPKKYEAIVAALAGGLSIRGIAKALKVSHNTVRGIRDREGLAIDTHKKGIAKRLKAFADAGAERLVEEVDSIPIDRLPLALGIAIDKMQLLDGEATSIDEVRHHVSFEDFNDLVAKIPGAKEIGSTPAKDSAIADRSAAPVLEAELVADDGRQLVSNQTPAEQEQGQEANPTSFNTDAT